MSQLPHPIEDLGIDIYRHTDIHEFLEEYFKRCAEDGHISYRGLSSLFGYSSPGAMQSIYSKKRALKPAFVENFILLTGLKFRWADYFQKLVKISRIPKDDPKREERLKDELKELSALRINREKPMTLEEARCGVFTSLLDLIVHEIGKFDDQALDLPTVKKSIDKRIFQHNVAQKLSQKILKSIVDLEKAELIVKDDDNNFIVKNSKIDFEEKEISNLLSKHLRHLHTEILEAAKQVLASKEIKAKDRPIFAHIIATTPERFEQFKSKLDELDQACDEMLYAQPDEEKSVVVVLAAQMFKVTNHHKKEGK